MVAALMGMVLLSWLTLSAQAPTSSLQSAPGSFTDSTRYEICDSLVYVPVSRVDTSLVGANIFYVLRNGNNGRAPVQIQQSSAVEEVMVRQAQTNKERTFEGYRVRIFFKESARVESERVKKSFEACHPGIAAYRSYVAPYFKVTVGDFRTKSEAMQLMSRIISEYPTAFLVKEPIQYPVINREKSYRIDTLKVYKPIVKE